jgi:two-component system OmpR family response regulator
MRGTIANISDQDLRLPFSQRDRLVDNKQSPIQAVHAAVNRQPHGIQQDALIRSQDIRYGISTYRLHAATGAVLGKLRRGECAYHEPNAAGHRTSCCRHLPLRVLPPMRCLLIEDDHAAAQLIQNGLQREGFTVTVCHDGASGLALASEARWDVIVLDRMLPGALDGLEILSSMRERSDATPVLILSALGSLNERVRGLRSGCDDYLTKPFAFDELLARIEALIRRAGTREEADALHVGDLRIDMRARRVSRDQRPITLQPREYQLLEYLVRHQGEVVTRKMLLSAVWGYHFDPETNVIDVQMSRLRTKIDKDAATPLIHTVRGVGYSIRAPDEAAHDG